MSGRRRTLTANIPTEKHRRGFLSRQLLGNGVTMAANLIAIRETRANECVPTGFSGGGQGKSDVHLKQQ